MSDEHHQDGLILVNGGALVARSTSLVRRGLNLLEARKPSVHENAKGLWEQTIAKSIEDYSERANAGDADAQWSLGLFYETQKDYAKAVHWYRKAAEQGVASARCVLGWAYLNGLGVPQDDLEGIRWFRSAAEQGHALAQCKMGDLYDLGQHGVQDDVQALQWYRRAADQGNHIAQVILGRAYKEVRLGLSPDCVEAYKWVVLAADSAGADTDGKYASFRDELAAELTLAEIAEGQKRAWEWTEAFERREGAVKNGVVKVTDSLQVSPGSTLPEGGFDADL
jgi:TPR repeat protein